MKFNITPRIKRKSGMTLLELTVVILVLLSLISILFIGARAWKKGSDRSGCLIVIRNIQVAMRGDQNMKNRAPENTELKFEDIIGADDSYIKIVPKCPADKATPYTYETPTKYPKLGDLYAACAQADLKTFHTYVKTDVADW
jgi:prepilin-type N-terminal cleavage/methylation domain-containing protein